jgi:CSLREA domain-containing protein
MLKKLSLCVSSLLSGLFLSTSAVHAAVFEIANGDVAALASAINTANTNSETDTINLTANGTYTLTTVDNSVNGANGLPVIKNDATGLDLTINGRDATIQRNTAVGTLEFRILQIGDGATVDCERLTIANGKVSSTSGEIGAGIYAIQATLSLTECTLRDNEATGDGGALYLQAPSGSSFVTTVQRSTFSNNKGRRGGAIFTLGMLLLRNTTVTGNTAAIVGGGVYSFGGVNQLESCTFLASSAQSGNAIWASVGTSTPDHLTSIHNCVFQVSGGGQSVAGGTGRIKSLGHNLTSDAVGGDASTEPGGLLDGPGDVRNTNPNLGPLQNNGGPTLTHALVLPSPAVDAGDDSVLDAPLSLTTDQRGAEFTRRKGLRVDIGALESGVSVNVTTTDDHNDGVCSPDDCSLREAIVATNAAGGGDISFLPELMGVIQLTGALPNVTANLLLKGPGPGLLTVRRNTGGKYRIFTLSNGTTRGPAVEISGLTISNGNPPFGGFPVSSGGGILNDAGTLFVHDCVLTGNSTFLSASTYGGAIFNNDGSLTIERSTFAGNTANEGGAVASRRATPGKSVLNIQHSTLNNNIADEGSGGAIYNQGINAGSIAEMRLINVTLSGNSATSIGFSGGAGGAIYNFGSTSGNAIASLLDCTLSGNQAASASAIYNRNFSAFASFTLRNTILNGVPGGSNLINDSGDFQSAGFNLSNDGAGGFGGTEPGGYLNWTGDIRNTDPLLGPLQDNGGPTLTHALVDSSPAINAGDTGDSPPEDQRGFLRTNRNDIGAFEFFVIPSHLANISTRLRVETGENVLIGGFIVSGTEPKKVIIRGMGPSLPFADKLVNPTLELYGPNGLIEANDNWVDSPNKQAIIDSTVAPSNDLESAIVATLPAGNSAYTAIVRGVNNETGIGVVEAYDLDGSVDSKLANISTRGFVQTGDNVLIAGMIVLGSQSQKVIVRAIGSSLPLTDKLENPTLELRDGDGGLVESNDNWIDSPNKQAIIDSTIPPANDLESAIVRSLAPGAYTAIVRGVNDTTGIAVVEVYALP